MAAEANLVFLTILQLMEDSEALGQFFSSKSWYVWKVLLKASFGLLLTKKEMEVFCEHTRRTSLPQKVKELWLVIGRRGGKSRIAALISVFLAFFIDWNKILPMGEKGYIMLIYPDRRQARVTMSYITAFIDAVPMLEAMVERRTRESIYLTNNIIIEITTCNFRTIRGYTVVAAIADEIAFWRSDDSSNPDFEVLGALRPAMATVPNSLLICISSPYSRRGALWEAYRKHYGKEDDSILVWQAPSRSMNPMLSEELVAQAYERDPVSASAEYGAEFRRDIESFVSQEVAESVVVPDRRELPPIPRVRYFGFVDPSGGSHDSMTMAVAHNENGTVVLDCVRERRPPFSPENVVQEFCTLLKTYRIGVVCGDRYAGEWPRQQFAKRGVSYQVSKQTKSDLYLNMLPLLNSGRTALLDNQTLLTQLINLERRTSRSGKESISHPPFGKDDLVNAVAGALLFGSSSLRRSLTWGRDRDPVVERLRRKGSLPHHVHKVLL